MTPSELAPLGTHSAQGVFHHGATSALAQRDLRTIRYFNCFRKPFTAGIVVIVVSRLATTFELLPVLKTPRLGVFMEPEVCHGETEVHARVQA